MSNLLFLVCMYVYRQLSVQFSMSLLSVSGQSVSSS